MDNGEPDRDSAESESESEEEEEGMSVMARKFTIMVYEYVTGGGCVDESVPSSWVREGDAMRRALVREWSAVPGVRVLTMLDKRYVHQSHHWDEEVVEVGPHDGERGVFTECLGRSDAVLAVAPETNGILRERSEWIKHTGVPTLGSEPEAISWCGDKARMAIHWKRHAIPTPPTWGIQPWAEFDRNWPAGLTFPAIVKPRWGAGCFGTWIWDHPDQPPPGPAWENATIRETEWIIQPYLPGVPLSASLLVSSLAETIILAVGEQRLDRGRAVLSYIGGILPYHAPRDKTIDLGSIHAAVKSVPGLRGWVGVDFLWNPQTDHVTILEINPRVTTSLVGLVARLPPGTLGTAWLHCWRHGNTAAAKQIAPLVETADPRPWVFDADGRGRWPAWTQ